jgi:hypothetical protein
MLCYCYRIQEKNVTNFLDRCHSEVADAPEPPPKRLRLSSVGGQPLWRRRARRAEESAFWKGRSRSFAEPVLSGRSVSKQ